MLKSVNREQRDELKNFQEYVSSHEILDIDKDILKELEHFITDDAKKEYSTAIDNYRFDADKIKRNNTIMNDNKVSDFWGNHKAHILSLLEDSKECPVCDLSYNSRLNYSRTVEHVFPKSEYQQYILSPINLVYFCNSCNSYRGNKLDEGRIFHPLFSEIDCHSKPIIKIFLRNDSKTGIKVTIDEPNTDYLYFIKLFKISRKYQDFIKKLINEEISSIENVMKMKLQGLSIDDKYKILNTFIEKEFSFESDSDFIKTKTEAILLEKLNSEIKKKSWLFARYVIDNSSILKDY